jgi:hypothetical protein
LVENITLIFREYLCIAVLDEDDFDGVKIPSELATRIEEWQRELERTDTFEHNNNFDWDNFGKRGIRLAIDLKKYIGQIIPSPLDTVIEKFGDLLQIKEDISRKAESLIIMKQNY